MLTAKNKRSTRLLIIENQQYVLERSESNRHPFGAAVLQTVLTNQQLALTNMRKKQDSNLHYAFDVERFSKPLQYHYAYSSICGGRGTRTLTTPLITTNGFQDRANTNYGLIPPKCPQWDSNPHLTVPVARFELAKLKF